MHWLLRYAQNLPELIDEDEDEELYEVIASGNPRQAAARSAHTPASTGRSTTS